VRRLALLCVVILLASTSGRAQVLGKTKLGTTRVGSVAAPGTYFNPSSLSFGVEETGQTTAAQTVILYNSGTQTLTISSIALLTGTQFTISANTCGSTLAVQASCTVSVEFAPTTNGSQSDDIEFTDNAAGSPQAVPVSGNAITSPLLEQFIGENGNDSNRSASPANLQLWNYDSVGPRVLTSGSLLFISGEWKNAAGFPAFTDSNSNSLTSVFASCEDSNSYNHDLYYEYISSSATYLQDHFSAVTNNDVFDSGVFYNVGSGTDGSSCKTQVTPANNTAPNITGTAFTTSDSGDLIIVEVDDESLQANTVSSITVPSGCSLLNENTTPSGYGLSHWTFYCNQASAGSFTPQFTVAQTTHDTFTIYAVAFPAGSNGSAPSAGPGILASSNIMLASNGTTYTVNVSCPVKTTSVFVTDDAGGITSITDSNGDSFSSVTALSSQKTYYYLNVNTSGMPNTYSLTMHTSTAGNVEEPNFYCTNTTSLDTGFVAAGTDTQITSSTIGNTVTQSTGGALGTYTDLPTGTPGHAGDLFIINCPDGTGPILQPSQPSGTVADWVGPAALANITAGDADDYLNGDMAGHFYQATTAQIDWGWTMQNNGAGTACMVTATY